MSEERIRALRALGATKDKDLMKRTLDFSLSEDVRFFHVHSSYAICVTLYMQVRGQDTFYGTASVSMNSAEGLEVTIALVLLFVLSPCRGLQSLIVSG